MTAKNSPALKLPKKLIEVALPLDAINKESVREKFISYGHPSTLHMWWARRPLASARAVIFAQMVNDPGDPLIHGKNGETEIVQNERARLFQIIEDMVKWENINNQTLIRAARAEIEKSWRKVCELNKNHPQAAELFSPDSPPPFLDPFAGGGALPLEASRLGLQSFASDLNPVAVLLNKAMLEIPPRFAHQSPVGGASENKTKRQNFKKLLQQGSFGLAEDVRHYGEWMHRTAAIQIGHLYPPIALDEETQQANPRLGKLKSGAKLPVVAWLWARTVRSPDPRHKDKHTPLVSNFTLSSCAYVEPVMKDGNYIFVVRHGEPPKSVASGTRLGDRGLKFRCLFSGETVTGDYVKAEGKAGRMGQRLMAIVASAGRQGGRVYFSPNAEHEKIAFSESPEWKPSGLSPTKLTGGTCSIYGLTTWGDFFTNRQLVGLNTFSALIHQAKEKCRQDAISAGMEDDDIKLEDGGAGATAYSEAVGVYLSLGLSRVTEIYNSLCRWGSKNTRVRGIFGRQSIAMIWDYAENNILGGGAGSFTMSLNYLIKVIGNLNFINAGKAIQADAQKIHSNMQIPQCGKIIATDPPYYDNIAYADISDFFYVWLRKNLRGTYPSLFATMQTPKNEELVALAYRHESKQQANDFFMDGMKQVMQNLRRQAHPAFPITIYYAFKQSQTDGDGTFSAGWASFLTALIDAGFTIAGTWPMRTEMANRQIGIGTNALASSIVLACRPRADDCAAITRKEFIHQLNKELPPALKKMRAGEMYGDIAPVDMSQALIGPGMEIFSRYREVLTASGKKMDMREALTLVNQYVGENRYDAATRFCLRWFKTHQWSDGVYGDADTMARAMGADIGEMKESGALSASKGKVRLLRAEGYPPPDGKAVSVWQALHHVAGALAAQGYGAAGEMLEKVHQESGDIKDLAHHLYTVCERKQWSEDGKRYNAVVADWSGIHESAGKWRQKIKGL